MRRIRLSLSAVQILLLAVVGGMQIVGGIGSAHSQQDIQCGSTQQRYSKPGDCATACKGQVDGQRCMIQPQLKILNDGYIKSFYNIGIFFGDNRLKAATCVNPTKMDASLGTNFSMSMPEMNVMLGTFANTPAVKTEVREKLVERSFGAWFHPNLYAKIHISWEPPNVDYWAMLDAHPGKDDLFTLHISKAALCRSPAGFETALAHELIHKEQRERVYRSVGPTTFGAIRKDFMEDEAYSWELRNASFNWQMQTIKSNPFLAGETRDEIKESQTARDCYNWATLSEIDKLRNLDFGAKSMMDSLENFMKEDPWIKTVWLPAHSNWRTTKAGPEPAGCADVLSNEEDPAAKKPAKPAAKTPPKK